MKTKQMGHYGPEMIGNPVRNEPRVTKRARVGAFLKSLELKGARDVVLVTVYSVFAASVAWVWTLSWAVNQLMLP